MLSRSAFLPAASTASREGVGQLRDEIAHPRKTMFSGPQKNATENCPHWGRIGKRNKNGDAWMTEVGELIGRLSRLSL